MPKNLTLNFFQATILYFVISCTIGALIATGLVYKIISKAWIVPAHVHLALIGFVSLTIMGAMYQIVPTILGKQLYSRKLAIIQFFLINLGLIGMFFGFISSSIKLVFIFGILVVAGTYLFAYIIFKTIRNEKLILTLKFFAASTIYVIVIVTFGILLASGAVYYVENVIRAHAQLGIMGWISMTIMGAMYQMLPMLSLKQLYSEKIGNIQFWLMNLGLIGIFLSYLANKTLLIVIFSFILALAVYLFGYNIYRTLTAKGEVKDKKEKMDISVRFFVVAIFYFIAAVTVGLLLIVGAINTWTAYYHLLLIGWVSITIVGAMYHIAPMLTWMELYSEKVGLETVPTFKQLYSEKLAEFLFWLFNIGVIGFFLSLIINFMIGIMIFGIILAIASYLFAYDMLRTIRRRA